MPMTKVYLRTGTSAEHKRAISDAIHAALVAVLGIPDDDKYHVFHELEPDNLITAPVAFGLERRPQAVFIQMYFGRRPEETLKELYRTLVANLVEGVGLETRDIYLNVVESPSPNWWADGRILDPATGFDTRIAADKVPTER
ncbi:tautomerase family protein [Streptomyces sp. MUM 16J]|uniref:tautomerase family protein n=1 Tax=Streptomyces sp. MUM 16J TaxID=2791988 RepID=UPI00058279D5|nr:tautomerase family protein [Streptomyces sp. MUM 16J]MCH0558438.1 tautomerase family protein [Streptomyces sp. MUM 16J]